MTNAFIENLRATVARDKKIAAEIEAGFKYLRDHLAKCRVRTNRTP